MPRRAPSPCAHPGCPSLTTSPRCPLHQTAYRRHKYQDTHWVYSTSRWKNLRVHVLRDHPYCQTPGCTSTSTDVDHIQPLAFGGEPYDRTNLQALCHPHHSQKTQQETFGTTT